MASRKETSVNVLQNVKKLVKYNTVSRDSNLPLVDYVAAYLEDLGIPSYRSYPSLSGRKYL